MKVHLMYKDQDFDLNQTLPVNYKELVQDLELNTMFETMAQGDEFLLDLVPKVVLCGTNDLETITYRQEILEDCIQNNSVVRDIYNLAVETIESRRRNHFGIFTNYPSSILSESVKLLQMFMDALDKLRRMSDTYEKQFHSPGFTTFFEMLRNDLTDQYFAIIQNHLRNLQLRSGILFSAELGKGNLGTRYTLVKPPDKKRGWLEHILTKRPNSYTFHISERDESGGRALSELEDRGLNVVANALAQSADHILGFFTQLKTEFAVYVSFLNLYERVTTNGEPVCIPRPVAAEERKHCFQGLYDICLYLNFEHRVVGNDLDADGRDLLLVTGANQGGKSTFLRSIGIAQLMMQCGLFVPAKSFSANVCNGLFTHFRREEDSSMNRGKFDEELSRMSAIADNISTNSLLLFNESFAATNEREGSEIASQITKALLETHIKVVFVTHMYEYAQGLYMQMMPNVIFLRAERAVDGRRTFKITQGKPLASSYGEDLYNKIFNVLPPR